MKSLHKVLMITLLTIGIYSINLQADHSADVAIEVDQDQIEEQIHNAIEHNTKLHNPSTPAGLSKFLIAIKRDLKELLQKAPNTEKYQELKLALENLNPTAILAALTYIKVIITHLPMQTKRLLSQQVPKQYHSFIGL